MNRSVHRCLFVLTLVGPGPLVGQTAPRSPDLRNLSHSLETVAAKVGPTVVQIRVTAYGPVPGSTTEAGVLLGSQRSTGSGVILSADGFIVTNAHVIDGGRRFTVILPRPAAAGVPGRSAHRHYTGARRFWSGPPSGPAGTAPLHYGDSGVRRGSSRGWSLAAAAVRRC